MFKIFYTRQLVVILQTLHERWLCCSQALKFRYDLLETLPEWEIAYSFPLHLLIWDRESLFNSPLTFDQMLLELDSWNPTRNILHWSRISFRSAFKEFNNVRIGNMSTIVAPGLPRVTVRVTARSAAQIILSCLSMTWCPYVIIAIVPATSLLDQKVRSLFSITT